MPAARRRANPDQLIERALRLLGEAGALPVPLLTDTGGRADLVLIGVETIRNWCEGRPHRPVRSPAWGFS